MMMPKPYSATLCASHQGCVGHCGRSFHGQATLRGCFSVPVTLEGQRTHLLLAQGDAGARRAAYEAKWAVMASAHADALLAADDVPWLPAAVADARDVVLYGAVSCRRALQPPTQHDMLMELLVTALQACLGRSGHLLARLVFALPLLAAYGS